MAGTVKCRGCGQYNGHSVNCPFYAKPQQPTNGSRNKPPKKQ